MKKVIAKAFGLFSVAGFIKRNLKWIVLLVFFLLMAVYQIINGTIGPAMALKQYVKDAFKAANIGEAQAEEILYDAGKMADFLELYKDSFVSDEMTRYLDYKTMIRILRAVDAYNDRAAASHLVSYEVQTAVGYRIPQVDDITGEMEKIVVEEPLENASDGVSKKVASLEKQIAKAENEVCTTREEAMKKEAMLKALRNQLAKAKAELDDSLSEEAAAAAERERQRVTYGTETRAVSLVHNRIDNGKALTGEDIFFVRWQPVVALCSMYVIENYDNWGAYDEGDEVLGNSHYLSDREIENIISIFSYDYTYYSDYYEQGVGVCGVDHILQIPSGYRIFKETTKLDDGRTKLVVHRQPASAPKCIQNAYVSFTYGYDVLPNGYIQLKERTCTYAPEKLVRACEGMVRKFDMKRFVGILSYLPGAEELTSHYEEVRKYAEELSMDSFTVTSVEECPSIGVIYSMQDSSEYMGGGYYEGENGSISMSGEGIVVPLYPISGWKGIYVRPGEWIVKDGKGYGEYLVAKEATLSLTVSDNLTLTQVQELVEHYFSESIASKCPLLATKQARSDLAECLYNYQQQKGASICGVLAIPLQEGSLKSSYAVDGWNFFNITTNEYAVIPGSGRFRDFKAEFAGKNGAYKTAAVNAFEKQINSIHDNYFIKRGQTSYYLMCWNGYNATDGAHAYESISMSYCPPWEDPAMPYSNDSYCTSADGNKIYRWKGAGEGHHGWINNCAKFRVSLYKFAKGEK